MRNIVEEILCENKDKKVVVFLKNGFRYEGVVLGFDSSGVKIDEHRVGKIVVALDTISVVRGGAK